ncbi:CPXCG motif-containing cysteine-rich protein [Marinimicrobium sp. C6131]|uniref:CPXCG motif-containing cysteine-rich protein n=1 Tax=Marinimicrobium sp. C6131 TaxID=3022676 RepID=UPI00223E0A59|nr:CPXCG motif-containing cysteine-rich protein [Marinimicrobium sp. C6131]UZJ43476.1 CPXCG motif-containing cysteine-rich protein [Marinimicrobium sp. C6131]
MSEQIEKNIHCPYCDEVITLLIDPSISEQSYVEDCHVCCQPISVDVVIDETEAVEVYARQENE